MDSNKAEVSQFLIYCVERLKKWPNKNLSTLKPGLISVSKSQAKKFLHVGVASFLLVVWWNGAAHYSAAGSFSRWVQFSCLPYITKSEFERWNPWSASTWTVAYCHPSGRIQAENFVACLSDFVKSWNLRNNSLLSCCQMNIHHIQKHLYNRYCTPKRNVLFCFTPHCTKNILPHIVSLTGSLTKNYIRDVNAWHQNNRESVVTHFQMDKIIGLA